MVNGGGYKGLASLGSLFKTRGSGVKYSKKRQYTKRKYERTYAHTKEAKAMRKAEQESKKLARIEKFNAKMNAKLLAPPKRRGRPKGSKNRPKRSANEMDAASGLLQLGGAAPPTGGRGRGRGRPKLPAISGPFS